MHDGGDDIAFDQALQRALGALPPIPPQPGLAERAVAIARRRESAMTLQRGRRLLRAMAAVAVLAIAAIVVDGHQAFSGLFYNSLASNGWQSGVYSTVEGQSSAYLPYCMIAGALLLVGVVAALLREGPREPIGYC